MLRPGGPNKTYDVGDSRLAADASHLIGQMFRLKHSILLHGALTTLLAVHDSWQGCTLLCYLMRASNTHTKRETSLLRESVTQDMQERNHFITSVGSAGYKTLLMFLGSVKCLTTFGWFSLLTAFPWKWRAEDDIIIVSFPAHAPCA